MACDPDVVGRRAPYVVELVRGERLHTRPRRAVPVEQDPLLVMSTPTAHTSSVAEPQTPLMSAHSGTGTSDHVEPSQWRMAIPPTAPSHTSSLAAPQSPRPWASIAVVQLVPSQCAPGRPLAQRWSADVPQTSR